MPNLARKFRPKGGRLIGWGLVIALAFGWVPFVKGAFLDQSQLSATNVSLDLAVTTAVPEDITFTQTFLPSTIGPGSVSTLQFVIRNTSSGDTVSDLAFSNTLPISTTIATPSNVQATCVALLDAPDGGTTISFSKDRLGAGQSCTITVNVTSSTPGVYTNVTGDLTSNAGNSGPAAVAGLTVVTDRPGFSQSFSPDSVNFGERSTVTFTIDNTENPGNVYGWSFTDYLPLGMVIADPANVTTTCGNSSIIAVPGTAVISNASSIMPIDPTVFAMSSCYFSIDVIGSAVGQLDNVTGELTAYVGSAFYSTTSRLSGKAGAALNVTADRISLIKSFTDDPAAPGTTATLEFTIRNLDRTNAASNIAFTDDLAAALTGLTAVNLPLSDPCGPGSQLTGTSLLTLSGGSLPPAGSCTFTVTLQVPGDADPDIYDNTTSSITAEVASHTITGSPAEALFLVQPVPILTKEFTNDPVAVGDTATLAFTITNSSTISDTSGITFKDELTTFLPFPVSAALPSAPCGTGSWIMLVSMGVDGQGLMLTGGTLDPGASCTFEVGLNLPADLASGRYTNTTEAITAVVDGMTYTGKSASDDLIVVGGPHLSKEFTNDPVSPGDTVTLAFTIDNSGEAASEVTDITFTDDLSSVLAGLTAVSLPLNDVCGPGSQISGTTTLSFSGGTLSPDDSCMFTVDLQVPAAALPGEYTNMTSNLTGMVDDIAVTSSPAQDDLQVAGLALTKSFVDDPVIPGDTVTLAFTIDNTSAQTATAVAFTDSLSSVLSGLTAVGLPANDVCGSGSQISGTTSLTFTGGNLAAGTSCTFAVTLQVPAYAASNTYRNVTSAVTAQVGGSPVVLNPAVDFLTVSSEQLLLAKSFVDDPVGPGDTVTLEFTIANAHATSSATNIVLTDDLSAVLPGLTAVGLPVNDVCGAGSQISGTQFLTLSGGSLAPGATCTFSVLLQVPTGTVFGTYTNTTGQVTGSMGGLTVYGSPATAVLDVQALTFNKAFEGFAAVSGTATLSYTIHNASLNTSMKSIAFVDDLAAALPGLAAVGLPQDDVCGAGSRITGTSFLTLTGANLGPGASCTFSVTLHIPDAASPGDYLSVTSDLLSAGLRVSRPAEATLIVNPRPTIYLPLVFNNAVFAPDLIVTRLNVSNGNIEVVIENQGNTAVTDAFWVDVYIDPRTPPVRVNQVWPDLADAGLVWGVTSAALPLQPGDSLTLTMSDAYFVPEYSLFPGTILPGTAVYAQVDSFDSATTYGAVLENHEILHGPYNNITGITVPLGSGLVNWTAPFARSVWPAERP